ncbi:50S ribosomal protein L33 [Staphylococcus sp. EG-SA-6]|uniref:Large ribosomal subunit protein bL33 n=1 Tax=Staphylococcus haemolyticus TaxID=1283 RepID=A0A2A1K7J9_STAHA|nr:MULTISPECIES: 50S ribosomal protein L33 [Staphylococcus]ECO1693671.1 50S ribosomal protein L33 [Listeria monocytogenes]KDP48161.1 ribosomal protein L33 [Staphylococcus aureus subsp. aureus CO-98]MBN4934501.1 50S ribosomal protein L33 [Staphylococcus sp. EG-SA-6]MBY6180359.1 50S ribosomal protein L33 [Staphylococcaceae bacterium DP2N0-1]MDU2097304.1 50S ribosomal protein L33 [Staphylococcus sp.]OLF28660.1 50S ribosomal protein L33 [Staphylococcus aureus]
MKKVPLICEVCGTRNYNVPKKETSATRLEIKKYCSRCNAHTIHKESK